MERSKSSRACGGKNCARDRAKEEFMKLSDRDSKKLYSMSERLGLWTNVDRQRRTWEVGIRVRSGRGVWLIYAIDLAKDSKRWNGQLSTAVLELNVRAINFDFEGMKKARFGSIRFEFWSLCPKCHGWFLDKHSTTGEVRCRNRHCPNMD